jgi:hypothetical protein
MIIFFIINKYFKKIYEKVLKKQSYLENPFLPIFHQ